jgi:hypothetical protein
MDVTTSILDYYTKDDSKYRDMLFLPYEKYYVPIDDKGCYANLPSWQCWGNPNYVHPDHYRQDWNMTFLNINPQDPCPGGFEKDKYGLCNRVKEEEHDSNFYTPNQFKVQYQYPNGYCVDPRDGTRERIVKKIDAGCWTFQTNASYNPNTGNYTSQYDPVPNPAERKYSGLPSRASYLGI